MQHEAEISSLTMSTPPNDLSSTKIRSRNPLLLNAAQEGEVRDIYYKRVRSKCTPEIKGMPANQYYLI